MLITNEVNYATHNKTKHRLKKQTIEGTLPQHMNKKML